MLPYIDVNFHDHARDRSLEGAIHRGVARLEAMRFDVRGAAAALEPVGRKQTSVCLTITVGNGIVATAARTHSDPFFAISDAFCAVCRDLLARGAADRGSRGSAMAAPRDRQQERAVLDRR
jgi:hypothetical protein